MRVKTQIESTRRYLDAIDSLLAMPAGATGDLIPKDTFGEFNSLYDLQNYVVGPSPAGMALDENGRLDRTRSFRRINYFAALTGIRVKNQVQREVGTQPVDFIAARIETAEAQRAFGENDIAGAVWLYESEHTQAVVLWRQNGASLEVRYVPVTELRADESGSVSFEPALLRSGLPLHLIEDASLRVPGDMDKTKWLGEWHTDREWLEATYATRYSNGIVGITEQFRDLAVDTPSCAQKTGADERDMARRFALRRRERVQSELLICASDHWNFNVRGFNPGGNHGSFLQASTHSVLMFSGGLDTGIPKGKVIETPYDSLSFVPTLLELAGRPEPALPGRPIQEVTQSSPIMSQ